MGHLDDACSGPQAALRLAQQAGAGVQAGVVHCCHMPMPPARSSHAAAAAPVLPPFPGRGRAPAMLPERSLEPLRLTKPPLAVDTGQG